MGIFNKNQDGIVQEEDDRREQERIAALAKNIYQDKNLVLAYDENTLILEHKRRHDEFALDGVTTLVTYTCEDRMMGTREIAIWERDAKERNSGNHPPYKKIGTLGFSKKEVDTFFHLYHDMKHHLAGKVLFYTPEKEFGEICFDNTDQILEIADGRRTYYIEYRDIIGVDKNTTTKTISTNKEHVGKTRVVSSEEGGAAGAEGKTDSASTTTIEGYDLIIYLDDSQFLMMKKHYEPKAGDEVQKMFEIFCEIVGGNDGSEPGAETANAIPVQEAAEAASMEETVNISPAAAMEEAAVQEEAAGAGFAAVQEEAADAGSAVAMEAAAGAGVAAVQEETAGVGDAVVPENAANIADIPAAAAPEGEAVSETME